MKDYEARLKHLVSGDRELMLLLRTARSLNLNQWCISAGAVRNLVWDHLHGHDERTLPSDIDLLFFDRENTAPEYEKELEDRLTELVPTVRWEAVNQATVHSYTGESPYDSIEHAMSRWADLVTAVGVCLSPNDELQILAPGGLDDLFKMRVRPNLVAPNADRIYTERMDGKNWLEKWPKLKIDSIS